MSREKFKELRAFKYNKLSEIFLILFASFFNIIELFKQKGSLKEKYKQMMYIAIFPVQKYIAVSITGVEFTNRKDKFITDEQLTDIENELLPGDILLKRNDWQATNLGIPGFWTHAGLYIGSIEKMDDYFSGLDSLNNQKFSDLLRSENKKLYLELLNDSSLSVIEAIEDGVSLRPLSNIAKVDYFCALRPIVREQIKANAVKTAFGFVGRPYDYHFNIESDNAFVCSELIQKAYGASINIPSIKKLGKRLILPNSIAKKYSKKRMRRNKELDFVLFYDLDVRSRKAYKSTEKEFSKSHRRNLSYYKKQDIIRYLSTIVDL